MDEKEMYRQVRDEALADMARAQAVVVWASERLGEPPPNGGGGLPLPTPTTRVGGTSIGSNPVEGTHEGEYLGETSTNAAYQVLAKFGSKEHLLKTKDLFDAVRKGQLGGSQVTSEEGFYKSLARSNRFKKIGRGTWGLMDWYPHHSTTKKPLRDEKGSNVAALNGDAPPEQPPAEAEPDTGSEVA